LAKLGYGVTVFEAQTSVGGLLVNGIPSFKLEKSVIDRRLDILRRRGVAFRTGIRVGWDLSLAELQKAFDAVFLGIGAQKAKPLGIPGSESKGVWPALDFLIGNDTGLAHHGADSGVAAAPALPIAGKRVVVLGGGDTAMDCLRTAIRCGAAETLCLYRRDFANMPGSRKEYANALEEGARFQFLTNPVALEAGPDGSVTGVRCQRMELGAPDASGRRSPKPVAGSEFLVPADLVVAAYGFDPVPFPKDSDFRRLAVNRWGGLEVDPEQMTNVAPVFAGGDSTRSASPSEALIRRRKSLPAPCAGPGRDGRADSRQ
jgi:glutamate synthase (NADPH/NADH) small chain